MANLLLRSQNFVAYPLMTSDEKLIRLIIFRGSSPKKENVLKTIPIRTALPFNLYDTNQEIDVSDFDSDKIAEPPKIVFQPSKNEPKEYFQTWKEADSRAESYWIENFEVLKKELELQFGLNE